MSERYNQPGHRWQERKRWQVMNEIDGWSGRIYPSKTVFGQQRKKKEKQMMKCQVVILDKCSQEKAK